MTDIGTETLRRYRRACDYLSAAMIYLRDNVLLREPLRPEHLKPRPLGHWGTCPGLNHVYSGLNRLVERTGQRTLLVCGPGHGAPAIHANLWLEGTHAEYDHALSLDGKGMAELVRRFSWPGGFPSHLSPEVPGVIHEGGELGYALATAFGAALDDPELMVACVVGDGEAETGPTAASWHSGKFTDPETTGTVLPILHLNEYKIASPTVFAAMSDRELLDYFHGCGWSARIADLAGDVEDPDAEFARVLADAYRDRRAATPPMVILRSPKGAGAPATDPSGTPLAGTFRAHQVPLAKAGRDPAELDLLENWLRSYRPEELFDEHGVPAPDILSVPPRAELRLGRVPEANGGRLRRDLPLPPLENAAVEVTEPGATTASPTGTLAGWLAELMHATDDRRDFRVVCPDELESNRLDALLEATPRAFNREVSGYTEHLGVHGRVMEVLSEHLCQGWLQGYLLTGRHGLFPCYEAFASIVDGMVNQYAKFLKMAREVHWRVPVASLNYLLSSEGWRQEHNGYSHQGPGFINTMLNKKTGVARVYLPPDANALLATMRRCLSSTGLINVVVASKQPMTAWLDLAEAERHCRAGAGIWRWASTRDGFAPDVVLACAGTVPTTETLAAAALLREAAPELRVRVANVVDLLSLCAADRHPHGMDAEQFEACFGSDVPVVFAFHGYPSAVHEVLHGRRRAERFHVHGYLEEGTTTTPLDLLASNRMSRYDLAADAVSRAAGWASGGGSVAERLRRHRDDLLAQSYRDGQDPAEFTEWRWS
jgi:xylulose-5-phosphate/fructose-6-phosphate phosphoketolase